MGPYALNRDHHSSVGYMTPDLRVHFLPKVLGGLPKQNSLMSPAEKRTVALHESGHAVAGWFLEHADPLLKVGGVSELQGVPYWGSYDKGMLYTLNFPKP